MLNFKNFKHYIFSISSLSYNIFISKIYFCILLSENNIGTLNKIYYSYILINIHFNNTVMSPLKSGNWMILGGVIAVGLTVYKII